MDVSKRLRQLREAKGYTVNRLANIAGVSQSYLRSLELGDKNPTVEMLSALCWALDISLRDFFDDDFSHALSDPLLCAVYRLSPEQRKALTAFLQSLDTSDSR